MYGSNSSIKYTDWTDEKGNAESVARYGGFYVTRYEAGVPETANFYASKEGDTYSTNYGNYVNTKWDVNGLYAIHKFKYGSWQWTSVAVM